MNSPGRNNLETGLRMVIRASAGLARHCDRVEHGENSTVTDVVFAGKQLRVTAVGVAEAAGTTIPEVLARHFAQSWASDRFAVLTSWADIQKALIVFDQWEQPTVFAKPKTDQVRHHTIHAATVAGRWLTVIDNNQWNGEGGHCLAEAAMLGARLATVCDIELDNDNLNQQAPTPIGVEH